MSPKQYAGALVVLAFAGVCGGFLGAWLFSGDADLEMRVGTIEAQLGSAADLEQEGDSIDAGEDARAVLARYEDILSRALRETALLAHAVAQSGDRFVRRQASAVSVRLGCALKELRDSEFYAEQQAIRAKQKREREGQRE